MDVQSMLSGTSLVAAGFSTAATAYFLYLHFGRAAADGRGRQADHYPAREAANQLGRRPRPVPDTARTVTRPRGRIRKTGPSRDSRHQEPTPPRGGPAA